MPDQPKPDHYQKFVDELINVYPEIYLSLDDKEREKFLEHFGPIYQQLSLADNEAEFRKGMSRFRDLPDALNLYQIDRFIEPLYTYTDSPFATTFAPVSNSDATGVMPTHLENWGAQLKNAFPNVSGEPVSKELESSSLPSSQSVNTGRLIRSNLGNAAIPESTISDTPVEALDQDRLGFETYVKALRNFIHSEETATPLTISIEGAWGVGKSSMMRMLQSELKARDHICVWFNAWKFDQEEEIWAALALAIFDEVKTDLGWFRKLWFWVRLINKRLSIWRFLKELFLKIVLPLAVGLLALIYGLVLNPPDLNPVPQTVTGIISLASPFIVALAALITGVMQVSRILSDPFQISIDSFIDQPSYKEKLGFYLNFETDFKHIVDVATQPNRKNKRKRKLIIFIDDLDRCEAPKAADIIESINLFLDSAGCVFVLGMDPDAVVASFETKYAEMFEALRRNNPLIISPGRNFLEKIIQIPFQVPHPTKQNVRNLVEDIIAQQITEEISANRNKPNDEEFNPTETQKIPIIPTPVKSSDDEPDEDVASYEREHVQTAIRKGAELLTDNPRQAKRFINLFRLYIYIANERNLFQMHSAQEGLSVGINLDLLAVWVAMLIRWPSFGKKLLNQSDTNAFRAYIRRLSEDVEGGKYKHTEVGTIKTQIESYTTEDGLRPWDDLPLRYWVSEPDFIQMIIDFESLWSEPEPGEQDWLLALISMSSVTPIGIDRPEPV